VSDKSAPPAGGPDSRTFASLTKGPADESSYASIKTEESILSVIDKLKVYKGDISSLIMDYQSRMSLGKIKDLRPMILSSQNIIVLPAQLLNYLEEPAVLLTLLAQRLGYEIRVYESEKSYKKILTEEGKSFVRGMVLAVHDNDQIVNIGRKSTKLTEGMAFARAAQTIGMFSQTGRDRFLVKNHYYFANNPGEKQIVAKREIGVTPIKESLSSLFGADESYLSTILYTLLKKSWSDLSEKVRHDLKDKYTMAFGAYVHLYESQTFVISTKRGQRARMHQETTARVPSKPKSRSLMLQPEFEFLLKLHEVIYETPPYAENKEAFVKEVWSDRGRNLPTLITKLITDKSLFLQKFAQLTTRRLQEFRKFLKKPDLRKADISIQDIESALRSRGKPYRRFIDELVRMDTNEISEWIRVTLGISKGYRLVTLASDQYLKLSTAMRSALSQVEPYKSDEKSFEIDFVSENEFPALGVIAPHAEDLLKSHNIFNYDDAVGFCRNWDMQSLDLDDSELEKAREAMKVVFNAIDETYPLAR
jgi:hypothetical protein